MDEMHTVIDWLIQKEWSIYPFLAPAITILLSVNIIPSIDKQFFDSLEEYLQGREAGHLIDICKGVARDYRLRVTYLTGVISFAVSVISTAKSDYQYIWFLIAAVFVCMILLTQKVFGATPSRLATTEMPKTGIWKMYGDRTVTYAEGYGAAMRWLNLVLIIIIAITLPTRP